MLFQKGPHFVPSIHRLFLSIIGPVIVEEPVSGSIVPVELIVLPLFLEFLFVLVYLLWRGSLILIAKESKQGAGQVFGEVDGRRGLFGVQFFLRHDHTSSPALYGSIKAVKATSRQESKAAPGTSAEETNLSVYVWERPEVSH